ASQRDVPLELRRKLGREDINTIQQFLQNLRDLRQAQVDSARLRRPKEKVRPGRLEKVPERLLPEYNKRMGKILKEEQDWQAKDKSFRDVVRRLLKDGKITAEMATESLAKQDAKRRESENRTAIQKLEVETWWQSDVTTPEEGVYFPIDLKIEAGLAPAPEPEVSIGARERAIEMAEAAKFSTIEGAMEQILEQLEVEDRAIEAAEAAAENLTEEQLIERTSESGRAALDQAFEDLKPKIADINRRFAEGKIKEEQRDKEISAKIAGQEMAKEKLYQYMQYHFRSKLKRGEDSLAEQLRAIDRIEAKYGPLGPRLPGEKMVGKISPADADQQRSLLRQQLSSYEKKLDELARLPEKGEFGFVWLDRNQLKRFYETSGLTEFDIGVAKVKVGPLRVATAARFTKELRGLFETIMVRDPLTGEEVPTRVPMLDEDGNEVWAGIATRYAGHHSQTGSIRKRGMNVRQGGPDAYQRQQQAYAAFESAIERAPRLRRQYERDLQLAKDVFARLVFDFNSYSKGQVNRGWTKGALLTTRSAPKDEQRIKAAMKKYGFQLPEWSKVPVPRDQQTPRLSADEWKREYGLGEPRRLTQAEGDAMRAERAAKLKAGLKASAQEAAAKGASPTTDPAGILV
ncbi:MAG: hypothetical protein EBR88_03555, partial [Betaproteobacteria bacterium]|nr:hypothetical protein [Betaproteobacteria bacterium]